MHIIGQWGWFDMVVCEFCKQYIGPLEGETQAQAYSYHLVKRHPLQFFEMNRAQPGRYEAPFSAGDNPYFISTMAHDGSEQLIYGMRHPRIEAKVLAYILSLENCQIITDKMEAIKHARGELNIIWLLDEAALIQRKKE
jgi:hypothetical protein